MKPIVQNQSQFGAQIISGLRYQFWNQFKSQLKDQLIDQLHKQLSIKLNDQLSKHLGNYLWVRLLCLPKGKRNEKRIPRRM